MLTIDDFENTIVNTFEDIVSIDIYRDGVSSTLDMKSAEFKEMLEKLTTTFSNGRLMPALGVSIHNLTVKEMKTGDWMKLNFSHEHEKNGLPFTSLLFRVEDGYGMNLIRENNNKFDGRCIYIDFTELANISDILL